MGYLYFALGLAVGIIFSGLLHANYRYPPKDNFPESFSNSDRDFIAASEAARERYWKKFVPSDVQQSAPGTERDSGVRKVPLRSRVKSWWPL